MMYITEKLYSEQKPTCPSLSMSLININHRSWSDEDGSSGSDAGVFSMRTGHVLTSCS